MQLLPSSVVSGRPYQCLTSFLIDGLLAIDAGSIGLALTPPEMLRIRDVVITHSHADHIASLPLLVAEVFTELDGPIKVYGLPQVLAALREHVFNDVVWPNFERIPLPGLKEPALQMCSIVPGEQFLIGAYRLTPVLVNHTVPSAGFLVESNSSTVLFTSDTYTTDEIWRVAAAAGNLRAIFVDVSYPNELEDLASRAKHFTPRSLAADLRKLGRSTQVYAVHIKPSNHDAVVRQLREIETADVRAAEIGREYEF